MGKAENKQLAAISDKEHDFLREAMWGAIHAVSAQGTLADWIRSTAAKGDEAPSPEEFAEMVDAMAERMNTHLDRIKLFVFGSVGATKP